MPLTHHSNPSGTATLAEQRRRLRLLADAYGLPAPDRARLVAMTRERVAAMATLIRSRAAAGDHVFAQHLAAGHADLYDTDVAHVDWNAAALQAALT